MIDFGWLVGSLSLQSILLQCAIDLVTIDFMSWKEFNNFTAIKMALYLFIFGLFVAVVVATLMPENSEIFHFSPMDLHLELCLHYEFWHTISMLELKFCRFQTILLN